MQLQAKNGYVSRHCTTCGREQMHFVFPWKKDAQGQPIPECREHSVWPRQVVPAPNPDIIVQMGSMLSKPHQPGICKRTPGVRTPGVLKGTRILFRCGHWGTVGKDRLCLPCRLAVQEMPCAVCDGKSVVLPACDACGWTYKFDARGGDIQKPCGFCGRPARAHKMGTAVTGKWGKRADVVGTTPDGDDIVEMKRQLFLRKVEACSLCVDLYEQIKRITDEGHVPFLPV